MCVCKHGRMFRVPVHTLEMVFMYESCFLIQLSVGGEAEMGCLIPLCSVREKKGYIDGEEGGRVEKRDRAVIVCSLVALSPHSMSGTFLSLFLFLSVSRPLALCISLHL